MTRALLLGSVLGLIVVSAASPPPRSLDEPPRVAVAEGDATLSSPPPELVKWSVTQGGLVLVLLVVLWSYRRDFTRVLAREDEETAILTDLVAQASAALQASRDASLATQQSLDRLARALDRLTDQLGRPYLGGGS